jgi:hypothetical protein
VIEVLDNARDVSERKLLETAYGVDMTNAKVIVTEFKLPIDAATYATILPTKYLDTEKDAFPMGPGCSFAIGFMIDDNDEPGTDVQRYMVWPASYSSVSPKECSGLAVMDP